MSLNDWFTAPAAWYALGFVGQVTFGSRFIFQWVASERARKVVIPEVFWYLSLLGGIALFAYAWHRKDPVFAFGQAAGLVVYARNLVIHRRDEAAA
jgi:lipid-A-disaccharide synthase-like uncharacterized protein